MDLGKASLNHNKGQQSLYTHKCQPFIKLWIICSKTGAPLHHPMELIQVQVLRSLLPEQSGRADRRGNECHRPPYTRLSSLNPSFTTKFNIPPAPIRAKNFDSFLCNYKKVQPPNNNSKFFPLCSIRTVTTQTKGVSQVKRILWKSVRWNFMGIFWDTNSKKLRAI